MSSEQLGSDVVLMGESAEDLLAADPVLGEIDRLGLAGLCLSRGELTEGAMRPGRVVVHQVLGQHPAQVNARREEIQAGMRELLGQLDGSRAARVALLVGMTREELEAVGGVEEDD